MTLNEIIQDIHGLEAELVQLYCQRPQIALFQHGSAAATLKLCIVEPPFDFVAAEPVLSLSKGSGRTHFSFLLCTISE